MNKLVHKNKFIYLKDTLLLFAALILFIVFAMPSIQLANTIVTKKPVAVAATGKCGNPDPWIWNDLDKYTGAWCERGSYENNISRPNEQTAKWSCIKDGNRDICYAPLKCRVCTESNPARITDNCPIQDKPLDRYNNPAPCALQHISTANCNSPVWGCGDAFCNSATAGTPSYQKPGVSTLCKGGSGYVNDNVTQITRDDGTPGWHWQCKGPSGHTIGCGAPKKVDGVCGSANGGCFPSAPTAPGLCSTGTATAVSSATGGWSWTCIGINSGNSPQCSAFKPTAGINGACTTTHYGCSAGTGVSINKNETTTGWTWQCPGTVPTGACIGATGTTASCSESKKCTYPTSCGVTYNSCNSGTAISGNGSTSWTCKPNDTLCPNVACSVLLPQDPTCDITPKNKVIGPGESVTLSWTSTNATSASAVSPTSWTTKTTPSGSQSVSPGTTTTYTLQVSGNNKTSTCSASVLVNTKENKAPDIIVDYPSDGVTLTPAETALPGFALKAHGTDPDNDQVAVDIQYYPPNQPGVDTGWSAYGLNQIQTYTPTNKPLSEGTYLWMPTATDGEEFSDSPTITFYVKNAITPTSPKPSCSASPTSGTAPLSVKAMAGLELGNPPLTGQVSYAYDFNYRKPGMKQSALNDKTTAFNTYTIADTYLVYCQIIINGQAVNKDGALVPLDSDGAWIEGDEIKVSSAGGGSGGEVAP